MMLNYFIYEQVLCFLSNLALATSYQKVIEISVSTNNFSALLNAIIWFSDGSKGVDKNSYREKPRIRVRTMIEGFIDSQAVV